MRGGGRRDAGRDRHGDATDLAAQLLNLADVDPGTHLDPDGLHGGDYLEGALDGRPRRIEDGEEAVPRGVHLPAVMAAQGSAHERVVKLDEVAPPSVPKLDGHLG